MAGSFGSNFWSPTTFHLFWSASCSTSPLRRTITNTPRNSERRPLHHGEEQHSQELGNITKLIAVSSCACVLLVLVLNYFVYDKGLFLFMTTVGCLFIFVWAAAAAST